jgi:hypothetical protein
MVPSLSFSLSDPSAWYEHSADHFYFSVSFPISPPLQAGYNTKIMRTLVWMCGLWLICAAVVHADLYQWTDADGVIHIVDESVEVPDAYRNSLKIYHAAKTTGGTLALPLSPSRTYAAQSQGAFAQKLAQDLGLIKNSNEDAFSPLRGAGIQPADGWKVDDPLTPEVLYEVLAAARRAANVKRLSISADGAEAIVHQAAEAFLPSAPSAQAVPPVEQYSDEPGYDEEPEVIIEQQPPQIIEVFPDQGYGYVPAPLIVGGPGFRGHRGHRRGREPIPPPAPLTGPFTPNPAGIPGGPTHLPFGASHLPFGASHMPFGSSLAR